MSLTPSNRNAHKNQVNANLPGNPGLVDPNSTESYKNTEATETPIAQTEILTADLGEFIPSVTDEFTGDESIMEQYKLLRSAVKLDEYDTRYLIDSIVPKVNELKKARLEKLGDKTIAAADLESKAELEKIELAKKSDKERIEAKAAKDCQAIEDQTKAYLDAHKLNTPEEREQNILFMKKEQIEERDRASQVVQNAAKKSQSIKLEKLASQAAALLPSQVNLTEAARQLMPGQSIDLQTTNHSGQEVTVQAVTVL